MSARAAIYLDSNAGAPLHPRVREAIAALLPFLSSVSSGDFRSPSSVLIPNPSSIHSHGRLSKRLLADAREAVAASLGRDVDPEQLVFTSSGTEANQLAIRSVLEPLLLKGKRVHWITTPVEHDSTLQMVQWLRSAGGEVSFLPVDSSGAPIASALAELWTADTALVSAVWVNNETGVISEVEAIAREVSARAGVLHLDAAQAWGKLPVDVHAIGAHLVTFSAHKIGALAGTGLLWLRSGTRAGSVIFGKQEKGRRGGTENLLGIVAAGAAAKGLTPLSWAARVEPLRRRLESAICERIPDALVNGAGARRVANTLNCNFGRIEGDGLVMALDLAGYSVSSGSACSSGSLEPSHVLMAMGRSRAQAMSAIRISLADEMPWESLEGFVAALEEAVGRIREVRSE